MGGRDVRHFTLGYLTLDAPPAETVSAAVDAGFRSVGIRITGRRVSDPYTQVIGNPATMREIRQRIDDGGITLSNISAYHLFPDVTWSHLQSVVETTAELGAKIIVANSYVPIDTKLIDLFGRYCELAGQHGIRVAVEFMMYSEAKNIASATRMVEGSGQANAGFLIDPLHLDRAGDTPATVKAVGPKRIIFVQICDAMKRRDQPSREDLMAEARTARLAPGDGELPLHDFVDALPPDTEMEYEVPRPEHVGLPLAERARIAAGRFQTFVDGYNTARGRPTERVTRD